MCFQWIKRLLLIPMVLLLTSCLQSKEEKLLSTSSFPGARAALNKGQAAEVQWDAAPYSVSQYNIYRVSGDGTLALVGTASASSYSFLDSNLDVGKSYSYIVRAVDSEGDEDNNSKVVTTVTFMGLFGVTVTGNTTAKAYLTGIGGAFDEIRIYAQPTRGGARQLLKTVSPSAIEVDLTGLRSGTTYNFNAQAYISSLGTEDGNNITIRDQTLSDSFHGNNYRYRGFMLIRGYGDAPGAKWSSQPGTMSLYNHIKTQREISLTWLPFSNANSTTKYKVVRVDADQKPDTAIPNSRVCTPTTLTSCVVCEISGGGPRTCIDNQLPPPPQKLRYAVTLVKPYGADEWAEELPNPEVDWKSVSAVAAVPPPNMVLVQRDSVNYEFCQLMGKGTDPKRWQRCIYTGLGATPKNSGPGKGDLNLETGFYDFGYNLFVDRWENACNWTTAAQGGRCGPGGSPGDCWGPENYNTTVSLPAPDPGMGAEGDVYYQLSNYVGSGSTGTGSAGGQWNSCYVKSGGSWLRSDNLNIPDAYKQKMFTNDPSTGHRPPTGLNTPRSSMGYCQARTTEYGITRIPRRREQMAFSANSTTFGEPDARTLEEWSRIENGDYGHQPGTWGCNSRRHGANLPQGALGRLTLVQNFSDLKNPGYELARYGNDASANSTTGVIDVRGMPIIYIGSLATSQCVSRYGVQDYTGNIAEWLSDQLEACSTADVASCKGVTSSLDSGNVDINNLPFDGSAAANLMNSFSFVNAAPADQATTGQSWNLFSHPTGFPTNQTGLRNYYTAPNTYEYMIPTLGIPLVNAYGNTDGNYLKKNDFITKQILFQNPHISISLHTTNRTNFLDGSVFESSSNSGRWSFRIAHDGTWSIPYYSSFRCVVDAD